MPAPRPPCLPAIGFLRETVPRRPIRPHLQSILSSRSAPSASAPSLHRPHSPDRAYAFRACYPAPLRRKSLPHHPPAVSIAQPPPRCQFARGQSGFRPQLRRHHPPTHRSPAATARPHRPRAALCPLPNTPDSPKSPATAPFLQIAAPLAHSEGVLPSPASLPASQRSPRTVRPSPSILRRKARQSS